MQVYREKKKLQGVKAVYWLNVTVSRRKRKGTCPIRKVLPVSYNRVNIENDGTENNDGTGKAPIFVQRMKTKKAYKSKLVECSDCSGAV